MPSERTLIQLRLRMMTKRAVDELIALTGSSREDVINSLLLAGLPVVYERLGIKRDPAAMTRDMLAAMAGQWDDTLADDELSAIEITRKAMERVAQVRAREQEQP